MNAESAAGSVPEDRLNEKLGVLTRREVEARILAPLVEALSARFGREEVNAVVRETVISLAAGQGAALANQMGSTGLAAFADSLRFWTQDGALEIDIIARDDERFHFDVTRCRYAEMYRALGIPEMGAMLSCNRDMALIRGFNGEVEFARSQTIMEGAAYCDFRYRLRTAAGEEDGDISPAETEGQA